MRLSEKELQQRKDWVNKYVDKSPAWWQENMNLVLDGVTLTMPPKTLGLLQERAMKQGNSDRMRQGKRVGVCPV